MSIVDSHGVVRIPYPDRKILNPCKCIRSSNGKCCDKNYCPCRKAGFYCGSACNCYRSHFPCTNSLELSQRDQQPQATCEYIPQPLIKPEAENVPCSSPTDKFDGYSTDELLDEIDLMDFDYSDLPDPLGV